MLGTTVATSIKATTKVAICLFVSKMVSNAKIVEYKLEVAYSAPITIMVTSTIGLAIKPANLRLLLS